MTAALRATLAANPSHVVACLDFKIAFGTIERTTCMDVLRALCPHSPAWLDVVNIMLAKPALVINPYRNHPARAYDGLPHRGTTQHIDLFQHHDRGHPGGAAKDHLFYIDDTVLVGPADDITRVLQELPWALVDAGLNLRPQKYGRRHKYGDPAPSTSSNILFSGACKNT